MEGTRSINTKNAFFAGSKDNVAPKIVVYSHQTRENENFVKKYLFELGH